LNGGIHSTDWSSLSKLEIVDLRKNKFSGTIPPALFCIPSLQRLFLSQNQFKGNLSDLHGKASLLLEGLDLSSNKFQGQFPMSVFELHGLKLSIDVTDTDISSISFPTFTTLKLASCNLMEFPDFLKNQSSLIELDLSKNQIHGKIPNWIWKATSLEYLNLSQNFFVEFQRPLENITSNVRFLDAHGNQLQGQIPILNPYDVFYLDYSDNNFSSILPPHIGDSLRSASFLSLANNNFHGSIPRSICNSTSLDVLDLSNNSLSGPIPQCLFQMTVSLGVLNLRGNNLSGIISDTFPESCKLQTLDLNQNGLEGKVPKSLENCKMLEVLDIGNNQINGNFPCHLKNIAMLHVLVLRSNKFNGHIDCPGNNSGWPLLQIFDLASNNFSGKLHLSGLGTWEAMRPNQDKNQSKLKHLMFDLLEDDDQYYYQDAITVTIKGNELELVKILTVFTSIDISCNNFEGPIPEVIGKFNALYALNFSHNAFTGSIPSFFGKLQQLESLDLSSNSLREASFENNAGLCGPPLKTKCGSSPAKEDSPSDSETGSIIEWNLLSVVTGFIFGLGIIIVPLIYWKRWRIWYFERVDRALSRLFPRLGRETKKHGRTAKQNQRRRT
ncbi:hypothetical protein Goshw_008529, partial [Gossypium schwendimanii]|nr:hypothetical protein [Gossypium schwendimanii]